MFIIVRKLPLKVIKTLSGIHFGTRNCKLFNTLKDHSFIDTNLQFSKTRVNLLVYSVISLRNAPTFSHKITPVHLKCNAEEGFHAAIIAVSDPADLL